MHTKKYTLSAQTENDRQKEMQLLVVTGKQAIKKKYEQLRKDLTVQKRMWVIIDIAHVCVFAYMFVCVRVYNNNNYYLLCSFFIFVFASL